MNKRKGMTMSNEDDQDHAIFLLTICVVLLTVSEILTSYQIERLTDAIQGGNDEQNEPIR